MITIDIQIKPRNRATELFIKIHSNFEDLLFSIVQKLPEKFIPSFLMNWLDQYTTTRIQMLHQQIIKQKWEKVSLEKAVRDFSSQQQDV